MAVDHRQIADDGEVRLVHRTVLGRETGDQIGPDNNVGSTLDKPPDQIEGIGVGFVPPLWSPSEVDEILTVSSQDAKAMARTHHPDVLAQQRAVKISDMAVEIAHRSMLPSLTAGGSASRSLSRTHVAASDTTSIGVDMTLSGPIYQGGQLSAQYRKAKAQSEANRAALYVTVQNVEQAVANAWAQLAVAQASLQASEQQIRASTVALRGAREEATLGARTTLEVLSFEQDLLDAQAARISAQSTQYLAIYSLISAMGLLTADDLRLGIATYDPEAYYNAVKGAPVYDISPQGARLDAIIETLGRKLD